MKKKAEFSRNEYHRVRKIGYKKHSMELEMTMELSTVDAGSNEKKNQQSLSVRSVGIDHLQHPGAFLVVLKQSSNDVFHFEGGENGG